MQPYKACKGFHAIAVLTEWDEFKNYDWKRIYINMQKLAFVFDGRGILNKKIRRNRLYFLQN
ncbi:UDP binding domain-containing protein [Flavivirga aquimarina]|uniref:UDP binding domain-containing protein n=1 Tax=Flavivirga aquimarina TaxID=2027862 RepID=UPI00349EAD1A